MEVDFLVLGCGPGGQKAAIRAAKAGQRVVVVDASRNPGGACVQRGTIPSKTLRETALQLSAAQGAGPAELAIERLTAPLGRVIEGNSRLIAGQLARNQVELLHGQGRFQSAHQVEVTAPDGSRRTLRGRIIVIATGSVPRRPPEIPIDHENILDSDSVLSLSYLPESLTVLGGGVISSEYASIFAQLGVKVTMIDKAPRPLAFMEPELSLGFVERWENAGGRYLGERRLESVEWDGVAQVVTRLSDGTRVESEKMLVALGRVASVAGLGLDAAGLSLTPRGHIEVDENARTAVPHIYAVGDVAGPPALAASAMEQGRRAAGHALGRSEAQGIGNLPIGIYTIPEMASVGLREDEVVERCGGAAVGRARFDEVARGLISGGTDGVLKLVADPAGERLLGVHVIGDGATELVHIGQMAILAGMAVEQLVETIFNFPTLAEAYRIAALDLCNRAADLQDEQKPEEPGVL